MGAATIEQQHAVISTHEQLAVSQQQFDHLTPQLGMPLVRSGSAAANDHVSAAGKVARGSTGVPGVSAHSAALCMSCMPPLELGVA